jgi:hypothetical protein
MFNVLNLLPTKVKKTNSGWHSFNAVCCHNRGQTKDKRGRGGIKFDGPNKWHYHCFNCGYTCGFELGKTIQKRCSDFLRWCGADEENIKKWSLDSLRFKDLLKASPTTKYIEEYEHFAIVDLPDNLVLLDVEDPKHKHYVDYLASRKIKETEFYVPEYEEARDRIVIPFKYEKELVGHSSRFLDNRKPKYIHTKPTNYLYNVDKQQKDWQIVLVMEGIFDAMMIDGVATLHEEISPGQIQQLYQMNKQVIYVPDQDQTGIQNVDKILEYGFNISLPKWNDNIKDVSDAVKEYGKLPTLLSILQSTTMNKIKIKTDLQRIERKIKRNEATK